MVNSAGLEKLGRSKDSTVQLPLQIMTGIFSNLKVLKIISKSSPTISSCTVKIARSNELINILELQKALENIQNSVKESLSKTLKCVVAAHNKITNKIELNFQIGDIDLVRAVTDRG